MKSFIRWAGSKRQSLSRLELFWNSASGRYLEPFAGSASLFFKLEPKEAILGDLNSELMTTLRMVKADVELVLQCLSRYPANKREYYKRRAADVFELPDSEIAARFIYLNRLCFNGLYRTNQKGHFNVPYCRPSNKRKFDDSSVRRASAVLSRAKLIHGDFQETLGLAEAGDFIYLDPPYFTSTRRVFREYLPGSFSFDDLRRLGSELHRLNRLGAHFLVTYADCPEAREILKQWNAKRIWTRRNIAGFTGDRRGCYEVLATNIQL